MVTEANSINAATTGIVGNTGTSFTATAVTQYNVLTGASTTSTINNVAPSATSGVPLISQGSSSQPVFGTAVVAGGGTGQTTLTNHGVLVGAGTSAITQLAAGTSGQVLQSGGGSADPAYSTATYPATATSTGTILRADGTNWSATTATYPNTAGTSGNILSSDGTNFVSSSASGAGASLVLIQSQNVSNVASVTFTSGITSTYKNYFLLATGVNPASGSHDVELQFSTNGGSSYIATNYQTGVLSNVYNSNTLGNANATTYTYVIQNAQSGTVNKAFLHLLDLTTGNQPMIFGTGTNGGAGTMAQDFFQGTNTSSTTINALKILVSTGNITGVFSLFGIRES